MSQLSIFRENAFLESHPLASATVALGRHLDNDIVLNDRTLSRFHARLERRAGKFVVVDLGGQNGVYVNGVRITGEAELVPGDRIGLGCYVAIYDEGRAASRGRRTQVQAPDGFSVSAEALDVDLASDTGMFPEVGELSFGDAGDGETSSTGNVFDEFEGPTTTVERRKGPRPTLVLLYNGLEASRYEVGEAPLTVGRAKACDVVISLLGLSRRHARIERRAQGIFVCDLGSQNGTWVNNERIENERLLAHGDLMNFYEYGLLYLDDPDVQIGFLGAEFSDDGSVPSVESQDFSTSRALNPMLGPNFQVGRPTLEGARPKAAKTASHLVRGEEPGADSLGFGEGSFLDDDFEASASSDAFRSADADIEDLDFADLSDDDAFSDDGGGTSTDRTPPSRQRDSSFSASDAFDAFSDGPEQTQTSRERWSGPRGDGAHRSDDSQDGRHWATDADLERALGQLAADKVPSVELFVGGQLYTYVPLSQPLTRIGIDARCELALPTELRLQPWHLTLIHFGAATVAVRASVHAQIRYRGAELNQAVLADGDELMLGRVRLVYRCA